MSHQHKPPFVLALRIGQAFLGLVQSPSHHGHPICGLEGQGRGAALAPPPARRVLHTPPSSGSLYSRLCVLAPSPHSCLSTPTHTHLITAPRCLLPEESTRRSPAVVCTPPESWPRPSVSRLDEGESEMIGRSHEGQLRSTRIGHGGHALHLAHHLPLLELNSMTQPRSRTRRPGTT